MNSATLELAPLLARRQLWLLLSVGFVDPYCRDRFDSLRDEEFRRSVVDAAALLSREPSTKVLGPGEISPGELAPNELFIRLDAEARNLEEGYRRLFGLTVVSQQCPPCEMEFEPNTDISYRSQRLADVAGFYQAFGLQVFHQTGERLDHISIQAEFLYLLLAKEAAALSACRPEAADVCRQARRSFFQEHMGWWVPAFSRLLGRVASSPYYRQLAKLAAGLSALERISLGLPPFNSRIIPRPSESTPEATCFGCAAAQHVVNPS